MLCPEQTKRLHRDAVFGNRLDKGTGTPVERARFGNHCSLTDDCVEISYVA
jgi:hypothetical protein